MNDKLIRFATLACSGGLFLLALTQPCYCTNDCVNSVFVWLLGWLGLMVELGAMADGMADFFNHNAPFLSPSFGASITWLANPLLGLGWVLLEKRPQGTMGASLLAAVLSLSFLLFDRVMGDEAGNYYQITAYRAGYWLWTSSCLTLLAGSALLTYTRRRSGLAVD